jgi:hypothetical protein
MKLHKAWRLTHVAVSDDTMTFRKKESYLRMVRILTRDGVLNQYKSERVFILR